MFETALCSLIFLFAYNFCFQTSGDNDIESSQVEEQENTVGLKVEEQENTVELLSSNEAAPVQLPDGDGEDEAKAEGTSDLKYETISDESTRIRGKIIPPPSIGHKIYEIDPMLNNHRQHLDYR